jgi:Raf kinase inhibitor-like YbhB/YbcL family protein
MKISSPVFGHGDSIPPRYSRDGDNFSPPLQFEGVPPEARSLVLIADDPDAPHGTFTHWVVFNVDPHTSVIEENHLPEEVRFGLNDWEEAGYGGPRPPDGEHRYYFKLYALDELLSLPTGIQRRDLERAMETHVVANAELMGRFAAPQVAAR